MPRRGLLAVAPYGSKLFSLRSSGASPGARGDDALHCACALRDDDDAEPRSDGDCPAASSGRSTAASPGERSFSGIGDSSWQSVALPGSSWPCVAARVGGGSAPTVGVRGSCARCQGRPSGGSGVLWAWAGMEAAVTALLATLRVAAPLRASTAGSAMPAHLVRSAEPGEPPAPAGSAGPKPAKRKIPLKELRKVARFGASCSPPSSPCWANRLKE